MLRTKHIVVFPVILIVLLIVVGLFLIFRNSNIAFYGNEHTALLIQSERIVPTAEVSKDTTRETTRSSLRAALNGYGTPEGADGTSPVETEEVRNEQLEIVEDVEAPIIDSPSTIFLCTDSADAIASVDTWGLINTTLAEGARIIASLERDGVGISKHYLQIPMTPSVLAFPQCLKQGGMVGIALDGRVIKTDTPFNTKTEGIAGYALDGYGIFSMYENGNVVRSADLDQCHGHIHTITWNGELMSLYHYHVTEESPYTLGCFRGAPVVLP